ncbi:unnamed protein product, partial [Amoebophrya sp. A120]|eukprot:GSA120T00008114001.1
MAERDRRVEMRRNHVRPLADLLVSRALGPKINEDECDQVPSAPVAVKPRKPGVQRSSTQSCESRAQSPSTSTASTASSPATATTASRTSSGSFQTIPAPRTTPVLEKDTVMIQGHQGPDYIYTSDPEDPLSDDWMFLYLDDRRGGPNTFQDNLREQPVHRTTSSVKAHEDVLDVEGSTAPDDWHLVERTNPVQLTEERTPLLSEWTFAEVHKAAPIYDSKPVRPNLLEKFDAPLISSNSDNRDDDRRRRPRIVLTYYEGSHDKTRKANRELRRRLLGETTPRAEAIAS